MIAEGLTASSLDLGESISTAAGFNLNGRCPLESEEWQSCPPTDSDNGLIVATEINERVETFKKLGIHNWCGNLSGKTSGFHEYVQPHLNEASLKVVSTISEHFIHFSMICLSISIEEQLSRCCQVLTVYSTDYERTIMEHNETSKFKIQQPPRSMLRCGLEEDRFVFVTRSLAETLAAARAWNYDKESLVAFCNSNLEQFGEESIVLSPWLAPYPFLKEHVKKNLVDLLERSGCETMEEVTLRHVQNRLASRGGQIGGKIVGDNNVKNKKGWFDPANAGVMKDGKRRGGKIVGDTNVKNNRGWFDPANAAAVKDGSSRGGKTTGDNNVKNTKGWFDPANAGVVKDGNSRGGAQNKGKRLGDGFGSGVIDKNGKRSLTDTKIVEEVISTVDLDILEDIVMKSSVDRFSELLNDRDIKFNVERWYDKGDVPGVRSLLVTAINYDGRLMRGRLSDTEIVEEVISTVDLDILEDIERNSRVAKFIRLLKDRGIRFGRYRWYDKDDVPGVRSLLSDDIAISKEVLRLEQSNKF